jgi:hypothetical protein
VLVGDKRLLTRLIARGPVAARRLEIIEL